MRKLFSSKGKRNSKKVKIKKYIPYLIIIPVCMFLIIFGLSSLLKMELEDAAAKDEYDGLREIFLSTPQPQETPEPQETPKPDIPAGDSDGDDGDEEDDEEDEAEEVEPLTMDELARINPDFVGWISIKNHLEYPVVRGNDNDRYINITFSGQQNSAGAIFMDYRNSKDFNDNVTIIYGHRTRRGMMFSPVTSYLDNSFLRANPIITITARDGKTLTYRIFSAKQTDAWDAAFSIGFTDPQNAASVFPNAPANASKFLLLSTCTASDDQDERIIVFAALEE